MTHNFTLIAYFLPGSLE